MKEGITLKRKIALGVLLVVAIIYSIHLYQTWESDVVTDLQGKIYYTKRVDGVLQLFSANANLTDEKLIYSHSGEENNNIIDFYYDKEADLIYFIAMDNREWCLFSIKKEGTELRYMKRFDKTEHWKEFTKYYIQTEFNSMMLKNKNGSLYLIKGDKEELLKKFTGIYDSKFNAGFVPIGFSPDGKYVIYHATEHFTPIGTLLEGMLRQSVGQTYIMDLETKKIESYPDFYHLQWIIDN